MLKSNEAPAHKLFAKARINNRWKFVTYDCVGLSAEEEPGARETQEMIREVKAIVQSVLGRAYKVAVVQ